jgi:hypothetical protein
MKLKYVIIADCFPIIFREAHKHSDFANNRLGEPTSAGFCQVSSIGDHGFTVSCYGKSISLGVGSKPTGIERLFNDE